MLFTFPSQYWSSIGLPSIFSLTGWSPQIPTGFLVSRRTQESTIPTRSCPYGIITLYDVHFHTLPVQSCVHSVVLQPRHCRNSTGLGSFLFAHHYSGNRFFFLFLQVLRCFSSLGMLLNGDRPSACRVSPFGHLRINSCLPIPADFRSLPRPSSPMEAKASSVRSYLLRLESFSRNLLRSKLPLFMKL